MAQHMLISHYLVMRSAAGYYVGRYCYEHMGGDDWLPQPYDRLTGYTSNPDVAEQWLAEVKADGEPTGTLEQWEAKCVLHKMRKHFKAP